MKEILEFLMEYGAWIAGAATFIFGLLGGHFISIFKKFMKKGSTFTKQLGEAFIATSDVFEKIDQSIKEDGTFKENSIKEIIAEGKEAFIEWEDVVIEIKPKKKTKSISSEEPELPPFPPKP